MDAIMAQALQRLKEKVELVPWEALTASRSRADSTSVSNKERNLKDVPTKQLIADAINSCHALVSLMKTY
jgi:hypothetical protein